MDNSRLIDALDPMEHRDLYGSSIAMFPEGLHSDGPRRVKTCSNTSMELSQPMAKRKWTEKRYKLDVFTCFLMISHVST